VRIVLERARVREEVPAGVNAQTRILVADDDPGVLDVVSFMLRREGFAVDEEKNGTAALEAALANSVRHRHPRRDAPRFVPARTSAASCAPRATCRS